MQTRIFASINYIVFILYRVNKEKTAVIENVTSTSILEQLYKVFEGGVEMEGRLIDIYIFTAIIAATVIMTLGRSFWFFNVMGV